MTAHAKVRERLVDLIARTLRRQLLSVNVPMPPEEQWLEPVARNVAQVVDLEFEIEEWRMR